jgi:hypothetical protein
LVKPALFNTRSLIEVLLKYLVFDELMSLTEPTVSVAYGKAVEYVNPLPLSVIVALVINPVVLATIFATALIDPLVT